jgi:ELWxxDGT repeat protein
VRPRRDGALALAVALLLTSCSSSSIEPARYLFAADDAEHGMELWISDGTEAGTSMVADLEPGAPGSFPSSILRVGDLWYFTLGSPAFQVWRTDGTTEGTARVAELPRPSGVPSGETAGVELAAASGPRLFFTFYDAAHGRELWTTTGTEESTQIVADLTPGSASTPIRSWRMGVFEGRLFFAVEQGSHVSLIRSDGTEAGTSEVFRFSDDLMPKSLGRTLLLAAPHDLLHTDGTRAGTALGASINRSRILFLDQIAVVGDSAYFPVHSTNGVNHSFWRSDGTAGGTVVVKDFGTTIVPLTPASHGTRAFFWASRIVGDGLAAVNELWTTNGTEEGTRRLSSLPEGTLAAFVDTRDHLFFEMWDTVSRPPVYALGASDGTEAGTHLLERFVRLERKENVGGTLMFLGRAIEPDRDYGLWRSDGTREGTVRLRAFRQP